MAWTSSARCPSSAKFTSIGPSPKKVAIAERRSRARRIQKFLSQPFFVAEQFTGFPGKYVPIADTVRSFREIVDGKYDHLPEQAFYMVGTIEEAVEKAEKMKG